MDSDARITWGHDPLCWCWHCAYTPGGRRVARVRDDRAAGTRRLMAEVARMARIEEDYVNLIEELGRPGPSR